MLVPTMLSIAEIAAQGEYTEEQVFELGIPGEIVFLVVVPELGACSVPDVALTHFMAGAESFAAVNMPEHFSGALSGAWCVTRENLRVLSDSWEKYSQRACEMVHVETKECGRGLIMSKADYEADQAEREKRHATGRFTMREAAEKMGAAHGLDASDFLEFRMKPAFDRGYLVLIDPEDGGPVERRVSRDHRDCVVPRSRSAQASLKQGRACDDQRDWVTPANMDKWLASREYSYRWPNGSAASADASEPANPHPVESILPVLGKLTWKALAMGYMVQKLRTGQHSTAKALDATLRANVSENDSPFELGTGEYRGHLVLRATRKKLDLKTIQNHWQILRSSAGLR